MQDTTFGKRARCVLPALRPGRRRTRLLGLLPALALLLGALSLLPAAPALAQCW